MKKSQILSILLLSILLLTACGGAPTPNVEATVQAALAATQTAQPTNTPVPTNTPIPPTATPTPTLTPTPVPPTATPTKTSTPKPTPTPTFTPVPQPTLPPGVLYEDTFNKSGSGWDQADYGDVVMNYRDGEYFIRVKKNDWLGWSKAGLVLADFAAETKGHLVKGATGGYGLLFRVQNDSNYYIFAVNPPNRYGLFKIKQNEWIDLGSATSNAIKTDQNTLRVEAFGEQISVFINGQWVHTVQDDAFGAGDVALVASNNNDDVVEAAFDYLRITNKPSAQPQPAPKQEQTAATPLPAVPPTPTAAPATNSSGFDVPAGKALFVFYNYTDVDWDIDVGPYFLQVPANKPGQEYAIGTLAIDPGKYTWQAHSPGGGWYITNAQGGKSFEFTVAAGEVRTEGVR